MDITIIEILLKDNINSDYFFLPYEFNIDNMNSLKEKNIYIPQFPKDELSYSEGQIKDIKIFEFSHNAPTLEGSSGSPIIVKDVKDVKDEKDKKSVIGIHKKGYRDNNGNGINFASFIYPIVKEVLQKNNKKGKYISNKKENPNLNDLRGLKSNFEGNQKISNGRDMNSINNNLNVTRNDKRKDFYSDGRLKYEGDIVNGKYEGFGKQIFEDGTYYEGQWENNKKNGKGILYYKDGTIKYDGDFINDKKEGNGKFVFENGEYYIGQWFNNKRSGKGKEFCKDGTLKYDGEFFNDQKEGNGKCCFEDGEYYIGQWSNGKMNGQGKFYDKNNRLLYNGNFKNGVFQGSNNNNINRKIIINYGNYQ